MAGFTKQQIEILEGFLNQKLSSAPPSAPLSASPIAPPPAPQACAPTPPERPPQLPPLPPVNPPSPCVETMQEVEHKHTLKHRASKAVPRIRVAKSPENCIGWPPKFGGIDMRFSRDEEPDAWYTTMLNHRQKLIEALPNLA